MSLTILIPIIITSALIAALTAEKPNLIFYFFKPLTTLLIIFLCLLSLNYPNVIVFYTVLIVLALMLSLGGDIVLISESRKALVIGLVLFLVAHIIYSFNLAYFNGFFSQDIYSGIIILVISSIVYLYFYPSLKEMKLPVAIYVLIISFMVWRAVSTFFGSTFSVQQACLLSIGAVSFYISDMLLAFYKFKKPFLGSRALNLVTYYTAQLLITLSAFYFR